MYRRAHWYFLALLLVSVIGFYPSYFARLGQTDAAHHFHGVTATAWMLLLVAQAWLMRTGARTWHRRLGWTSLVVAPAFLVSGLLMVRSMLTATDGFSQAFGERLAFLDLTTVAYFALAYSLALVHRRDVRLHARWMASTAVLVLPPAMARLLGHFVPGITSFEMALHGSYAISLAICLALLWDDHRLGKVRAPYLCLLALVAFQQVAFIVLPGVPAWHEVCRWIAGG